MGGGGERSMVGTQVYCSKCLKFAILIFLPNTDFYLLYCDVWCETFKVCWVSFALTEVIFILISAWIRYFRFFELCSIEIKFTYWCLFNNTESIFGIGNKTIQDWEIYCFLCYYMFSSENDLRKQITLYDLIFINSNIDLNPFW